eukprot:357132-Alexandrium_andersonii.AAC.1
MQIDNAQKVSKALVAGWEGTGAVRRDPNLPGLALVECGSGGCCAWNAIAVGLQMGSTGKTAEEVVEQAAALGTSLRTLTKHHVLKK